MHQSEVNNSVRREQSKVTDDPHRVVSKQHGRFVAFSLGVRLVVISGLAGAIEPRSFRAVTRAWKARSSTVVQAFAFSKLEPGYAARAPAPHTRNDFRLRSAPTSSAGGQECP